jgi:hypothetical protein
VCSDLSNMLSRKIFLQSQVNKNMYMQTGKWKQECAEGKENATSFQLFNLQLTNLLWARARVLVYLRVYVCVYTCMLKRACVGVSNESFLKKIIELKG